MSHWIKKIQKEITHTPVKQYSHKKKKKAEQGLAAVGAGNQ